MWMNPDRFTHPPFVSASIMCWLSDILFSSAFSFPHSPYDSLKLLKKKKKHLTMLNYE